MRSNVVGRYRFRDSRVQGPFASTARLALSAALFLACQSTPPAENALSAAPPTTSAAPVPAATPAAAAAATDAPSPTPTATPAPFGHVDRYDAALDAIVPADWKIEKLAEGFAWSEGPAWIAAGGYLLFTDVPGNTLHKWSPQGGLEIFLKPSGLENPDSKVIREAGLNGLFPERDGGVLAADSGERSVVRLDLASKKKTTLASKYNGHRFNSPNDVCRRDDGVIFFSDPPYGLEGLNDSKAKELGFNGVYRLAANGKVDLVDDQLSYPNGVALAPDQRTLYVANSDRERPIWMAYALDAAGKVTKKSVFADAKDLVADSPMGAPDGLTVSADGVLFATGPGGVIVMSAAGKRLGRISTGKPISNCKFGDDGHSLYLTTHDTLARIRLKTSGQGFPVR
jgi:gluconolactonase